VEDPRLSRMYFALLVQGFTRMRHQMWQGARMRSGLLSFIFLMVLLVLVALGWREHRRGQFAHLKRELKVQQPVQNAPQVRPGGEEALLLQRSGHSGDTPEFLSATLLPGRGANVLQITAYLPQKGEVSLLASPSVAEAARQMSGTGSDVNGGESLTMGGAIEAPWAGRISGAAAADGQNLTTVWQGHRLTLPLTGHGLVGMAGSVSAAATGGLLLKQASDSESTDVMPDGGQAQMKFELGDFDGAWLSQTQITTTVQLSSKAIEMTVTSRNTGTEAEPVGIGWLPHFAILSGNRAQATLRLPAGDRVEVQNRHNGLPSGKLTPVEGTEYDFTAHNGAPLGSLNLDDSFVHLRPAFMDIGPTAELRDPGSNYGLRLTAMSPSIKSMRVYAPTGENFVSIDPQFNWDDPFGKEWANGEDTGMVVLQPGQSVEWKIRLEIFPLATAPSRHEQASLTGASRMGAKADESPKRAAAGLTLHNQDSYSR
jgi:aldose 1-epimerase